MYFNMYILIYHILYILKFEFNDIYFKIISYFICLKYIYF